MNHWGRIFSVSIFGESHGDGVGITISGCPSGIQVDLDDFEKDLARRKAGGRGTTPRIEKDIPQILCGVFQGKTTGAPLTIWFENTNTRSEDYSSVIKQPRPGHADFVARRKYAGYNDYRGGGHFSGRLTLALVVAGVIAKKIVNEIEINASIESLKGETDFDKIIEEALSKKDSIGGIVRCNAKNIPVGWGEPFFDSVESVISHLVFSIPAVKGIEFGSGFDATKLWGSKHNDVIINKKGKTESNNSGGVSGGITNGNMLAFRVAVKPTSSIGKTQNTMNFEEGQIKPLKITGRHDVCIALRVPVVIEAITAMALADFKLIRKTQIH